MISSFHCSKRWSILPPYTMDGYIAYIIHYGSINTEIFNDLIRDRVLPQCTLYIDGGPRSVIVCDNARIYQSDELKEMYEEAGVLLTKLLTYSPDFNPIETSFSFLKSYIRCYGQLVEAYTPDVGGYEAFLHNAV